jgi:hypothetical protein
MNHISDSLDSIQDGLKDSLLIIDLGKTDPNNLAILFEQLNKVIIASTLLARVLAKDPKGASICFNTLEIKLQLLSILKLISRSIKSENHKVTHDLIRLELRDTLIRWIIQIIPPIRSSLASQQSGQATNSALN